MKVLGEVILQEESIMASQGCLSGLAIVWATLLSKGLMKGYCSGGDWQESAPFLKTPPAGA